jgi:hypothetical protein
MISKEEAKEIYIREELNFLKGDIVDKDLENEAISTLIDNDMFDEATEEFTKVAQEYSTEVISPLCKKLSYILENKGNLKIQEKEEIDKLVEDLRDKDKNFLIRSLVLENFFNSSKLSEAEKVDTALKVGALKLDLKFYDEKGYLV